jgi:hypothetical protein
VIERAELMRRFWPEEVSGYYQELALIYNP